MDNPQTAIARKLRNNLTDAEKRLWYYLRNNNLGEKFRRQQPIGPYYPDFVCLSKFLIVELDGGQHFESANDKIRDDYFKKEGFNVLRFWNNEVFENIEGVFIKIKEKLNQSPPPSLPPPGGGN